MRKLMDSCEKHITQTSLYNIFWASSPQAKEQTMLAPLHLTVVAFACLYLLPLFPSALSSSFYARACGAYAILTITMMIFYHGRPRFSKEYAARLIQDSNTSNLLLACMLYTSRPFILGVVPIASMSMIHASALVYKFMVAKIPTAARQVANVTDRALLPIMTTEVPNWSQLTSSQKMYQFCIRVPLWNAGIVVVLALIYLVELLTPRRSVMSTFMLWQYLRMMVMLEQTKPNGSRHFTEAFRGLDRRITFITNHKRCPAFVGIVYRKIKSAANHFTTLPRSSPSATSDGGSNGGIVGRIKESCVVM